MREVYALCGAATELAFVRTFLTYLNSEGCNFSYSPGSDLHVSGNTDYLCAVYLIEMH